MATLTQNTAIDCQKVTRKWIFEKIANVSDEKTG
jgi:hypothetical protein